jgi:eukaryotic-like serine/threonine-protein kinase
MSDTLPDRVCFGGFELDLRAGELRKEGHLTRLQEKPLRVLRLLVERGGKLVTREELQRKLWPNDTIVDFEHGINTAIKKLRQALADSPEAPKYIETIPRRGYRLMVPVEWAAAEVSRLEARVPVGAGAGAAARLQPEPAVLTGRTVSHYRVLDVIGGGGMGVVYRAEDLKLGRRVALKFLPEEMGSDSQALERFSREARAVSSLDHPNICSIYEFGEHEGRPFMVMQFLEGQTLRDRLAALAETPTSLPLEELLNIAIQVCHGLQAAHEKGIIHRDIKPANIFVTRTGTVKILDFGLVKLLEASEEVAEAPDCSPANPTDANEVARQPQPEKGRGSLLQAGGQPDVALTRTGIAIGTAGYMSPEQVRGEEVDPRSDLFSFGLVLYEMATGQRAFTGETAAVVHDAIVHTAPVSVRELNSALPTTLAATIEKALQKNREERYQSAADMRQALERVRGDGGTRQARYGDLWAWLAAACLITMAIGAGLYWRSRFNAKLKPGDAVVVADFQNNTSDLAFGEALKVALETELNQTPFLDVLGPDKVHGTLKLMNHSGEERLTPAIAREVCMHTNSAAIVAGSITDEGNNYRIGLKAMNCKTGASLAGAEAEAKTRNVVVKTLGNVGAELRSKLGEPKDSLIDEPLDEATSSSIEALQAFGQGERAGISNGLADAIRLYKQAADLDPNFALACAYLGLMYRNVGNDGMEFEYLSRAFQLRGRVTERDRFAIEASYYGDATGESVKASQVYTQWLKRYPRDKTALINLGALDSLTGQDAAAAALFRESLRLDPTNGFAYANLIGAEISLSRPDEALAVYREGGSPGADAPMVAELRFEIAFLQDDQPTIEGLVRTAEGDREHQFFDVLADYAQAQAYRGRFHSARATWAQNVEFAKRQRTGNAARFLGTQALIEALAGNTSLAREFAEQASPLSSGAGDDFLAASSFALSGRANEAESMAQKLNHDHPLDTIVQEYSLPNIRAAIELRQHRPANALSELQRVNVCKSYDETSCSFPIYLRGQAHLMARQAPNAAADFQKILDNPGLTVTFVTGALARLQLGRAQAMMGDKTAARKSYRDFLTLWKDADPDIPILKEAKAEYARLQ